MNTTNTPPVTDNTQNMNTPISPQAPQFVPQPVPQPVPQYNAAGVNPYNMVPPARKQSREYSVKENIFAWASFALAYLFCLTIPIRKNPLGLFVVIILMYLSSTVIVLFKGRKPQLMPVLVGISAVAVSFSLILTDNNFLHFYAFLYAMIAYCYYIYGISSDHKFRFADSIVADFVRALFVLPFHSFSDMFVAMFSGKANKSGKFILKVFIGLIITVIPTFIILLLLSYDDGFSNIIDKMFDFRDFDLLKMIVRLFLALPLGAYAYSIYISSVDNKCKNILTPSGCAKAMRTIRFAPVVTVLTSVLPILFLYVVFFISQWKYYVSGFTGVLPQGFSYAQYAREGFFQLCTVSVINLVILITISLFLKRKADKPSVILKVICVVFSVFTLVLISTAIAKMVMYINCYGLTPKRVYASWMMLVLSVVFVLIIVRQFVSRLRVVALSLAVLVVMFAALSLSGVESFIAKYNVDRYIDGSLPTVDVQALEQLGDSSVPQLVRLHGILDKEINDNNNVDELLDERNLYVVVSAHLRSKGVEYRAKDNSGDKDIWSVTVPNIKARKALSTTEFY